MKVGTIVLLTTLKTVPKSQFPFVVFFRLRRVGLSITVLNKDSKIVYKPYIDAGVVECQLGRKILEPLDVKNQEMKLCNGSNLQNTFQGTLSCTIHFDKW
jgi:hypothetical protein